MNTAKRLLMAAALCAAAYIAVPAVQATPVIGIGSMYDVLQPGSESMTKRIYNTGESTAFVRVELLEIHPGDRQHASESPAPALSDGQLEQNRLIVTPLRLIIPPGGFQGVRILWAGDRSREKYYRVRFIPVMPEVNDGFGLDKQAIDKYRQGSLKAGVNVLTGYGSIVIVQPNKPHFNSVITRSAGAVTVSNKGDATVALDNIRHCKSAGSDCTSDGREFILPGHSAAVNQPAGGTTSFTLIEGNNRREITQ